MKKSIYLFGIAAIMMASCTSDEFVGENTSPNLNEPKPIGFSYELPNMTRDVQGSQAADSLGKVFYVWGSKTMGADNNATTQLVFGTDDFTSGTTNKPYHVWWTGTSTTASNSEGWEYVGSSYGTTPVTLNPAQTIKYWDLEATAYNFLAYADKNTTKITQITVSGKKATDLTITGAVANTMQNVYLASEVTYDENEVDAAPGTPVTFKFKHAAAYARLGIYENVAGYEVHDVKFGTAVTNGNPATTAIGYGKFLVSAGYTVNDKAELALASGSNAEDSKSFTFGYMPTGKIKESLTDATFVQTNSNETSTAGYYIPVLPTPTAVNGDMKFYVSFTLFEPNTKETINVPAAEVTIPATYLNFAANTRYTYILKITEGANGLYPITFDATVEDMEDGQTTVTTVSQPTITTYQDGHQAGADYAAGTAIDAYVHNGDATNGVVKSFETETTASAKDNYLTIHSTTTAVTESELANGDVKTSDNTKFTALTKADATTVAEGTTQTAETFSIDATTGKITFTPSAATTGNNYYVITYTCYNTVTATTPDSKVTYYTATNDVYTAAASLTAFTQGTTYYTKSVVYKVVKIAAASTSGN